MELVPFLQQLKVEDATYQGEAAPGVHVFSARRAMHRVRAYQTAVLGPAATRGVQETMLLGHAHAEGGRVTRVEGFNGLDGRRWAEAAAAALREAGLLDEGAELSPTTPLKACPHTGFR